MAEASPRPGPAAPALSLSPAPAVSVLIAVHNGLPFIESAVRSMMAQTLRDIEIVIVDDASTDETPEVLARLAREDGRLRVERLASNLRLAGALNHGLGLVRAPLVARMDADDLSHPTRLEVQKRFLDTHPGTVAVGASIRRIGPDGATLQTTRRPRDAFTCRWVMRFRLPIVHPTVTFRYPMPDGERIAYDSTYRYSQDHDFFGRMMRHGDLACLPETLLDYRIHDASATRANWREQTQLSKRICLRIMDEELPGDVVAALAPTVAAYFDFERVPPAGVFAGLRRMLAHDVALRPRYATWLRRQSAQLAYDTLVRSRRPKGEIVRAFLTSGRDFLPALTLRLAEIGKVVPRALDSSPAVWATPADAKA